MFKLSDHFISQYQGKQPDWGFGDLSYFVYKRTYAREKERGQQEEYWETCQRVVEGVFSIQFNHCKQMGLGWSAHKAQATAQKMFQKMWEFKFLPPGRGLWLMGTPVIDKLGSAGLNNCGFISTRDIHRDLSMPFCWAADMLMLGVGIGFDTKGADKALMHKPNPALDTIVYQIPDTREGWVEAVRMLLESYAKAGQAKVIFEFSLIRKAGEPIRGFGGIASGPEPLKEGLEAIRALLNSFDGKNLSSVTITDIMNLIGKFVVSGNVRRSAEIAIGDESDLDFIRMKDPKLFKKELSNHRWASNNSIFVTPESTFGEAVKSIARNGEPGLIFLDNARHYGRLKDGWRASDSSKFDDVDGFNPCFTDTTWVMTADGPRQIRDLIGKQFTAVINGEPYKSTEQGFFATGKQYCQHLETKEGFRVECTLNHQFLTKSGDWKSLGELESGDQILVHDHRNYDSWSGNGTENEGYLLGLLVGDGCIVQDSTNKIYKAVLSVWEHEGSKGIRQAVLNAITQAELPVRSDFKGWAEIKDRGEYRITIKAMLDLAKSFGLESHKVLGPDIEKASRLFYIGFLRGFFDADGSVQGTQDKGISVRLNQSDKDRLQVVQRMLLRLGIYSKIYLRRQDSIREWSAGPYRSVSNYDLIISGEDLVRYRDLIGFDDTEKLTKLDRAIGAYKRKPNRTQFYATFECRSGGDLCGPQGTNDKKVYDATIPEISAFDANGFYAHNCAEQGLKHGELCCLVETFPANHESAAEYHDTLKFAFMYAKTVTLVATHSQLTNQVMLSNRRIGLSMSGIQQALKKFGFANFFGEFCDKGYDIVRHWDRIYSRWLGIPTSIKVTTVKPSGTVSLLAGATPGVHCTHSEYYMRAFRLAAIHPLVDKLHKAEYRIHFDDNDHDIVKRVIKELGQNWEPCSDQMIPSQDPEFLAKYAEYGGSMVVYFPVKEKNFTKSKFDISLWEQLSLARELQDKWSDNSVSITVTFKPEETKDLKSAIEYLAPYVKTLSFLPLENHTYTQAPYQKCDEVEYDLYSKSLKKLRLTSLRGGKAKGERYCNNDVCEI